MLTRPPVGEREDRWVGAHLFTGHPLDLVVGTLVPAVMTELRERALADHFFFLRHWQGGPHLRLRVRLTAPEAELAARAVLAAHASALFHELPPSRSMTARQYAALAKELSTYEPESEPGALAPNDSLAFVPYRREHGKYGHGAALRAVEDAFALCSELALGAVRERWSPARRSAHCFALLSGSVDAPVRASRATPDVLVQYGTRRAALLAVARAARTAAAGRGPADTDPVRTWLSACRDAQRGAAEPARLAGHLTHLACNRLGIRLGQEATLRALALLAVAELTGDEAPGGSTARRQTRHTPAEPP
ncbi:lantibiotic dehydratase C-terminal domain-containing protein [Streptomyces sp. Edi4]|uniref:lantibiotic dehydratase C-terminal domain-containing protein n=1 Tax=Streptomyces sp. Edi4 TaxID=3162527 RepID=UPI00330580E0